MNEPTKYMMMQTKVSPEAFASIQRIEKRTGISSYKLIQMFADTIIRYMDDRHNLTPEMERAMALVEHMDGWANALNMADPSVNKEIGEATYYLVDSESKKHGVRAVHVERPWMGNWTETANIQEIFERSLCLLTPERYRRLRSLAVEMDCSSLLELIDKFLDHFTSEDELAILRSTFEDANRSEYGRAPVEAPYKRKHYKTVNDDRLTDTHPGLFDDIDINDDEFGHK